MRESSRLHTSVPNPRTEADLVILELVRLVRVEPWSVQRAAGRLLDKRHTAGALRLARARVLRAQAERDSTVADRAARTIRRVLAATTADPPADPLAHTDGRRGDEPARPLSGGYAVRLAQ
jgi:hypothetical protein